MDTENPNTWPVILPCIFLALAYVGSLYISRSSLPRDHPQTIKRRMIGVSFVCIIGPMFIFWYLNFTSVTSFMRHIGLHFENIFISLMFPLLLTITLFLGPIVLYFSVEGFTGFKDDLMNTNYLFDLQWYRTIVVAPISEELIFRACMLPVLVPKYGLGHSIFIAPLLFGIAHFHHIVEELRKGRELLPVLLTSCFQMTYTTLFGAYSAFVFLRTGHLVGPILCHSFCNMMGFPDFDSIPDSGHPKTVTMAFILGLTLFIILLFPATNPNLYGSIYWT